MRTPQAPLAAPTLLMALAALVVPALAGADSPELATWIRNVDGHTGYNGIEADVQTVSFSDNYVYVQATGIPSYSIGPWPMNPNTPTDQNWSFRITRNPVAAGSPAATQLGQIGVWANGVVMFNALDAMSYQNKGYWHQNAVVVEASGFDACHGHPAPSGAYHHHQNPKCLYTVTDTSQLSPILGYAFDGFPVYGPYAYASGDGTGGVRRIHSSYRLRNMTQRTTLPDGTVLSPANYGPNVSAQYPLGYYVEDFEYVAGLGDLDTHNGRFSITPEYPLGTYAYFVTIAADGSSAYPYIVGPTYYGELVSGNTGPGGGHLAIGETVTTLAVGPGQASAALALGPASPNPSTGRFSLRLQLPAGGRVVARVFDLAGRTVARPLDAQLGAGAHLLSLDVRGLRPGMYMVEARAGASAASRRVMVLK